MNAREQVLEWMDINGGLEALKAKPAIVLAREMLEANPEGQGVHALRKEIGLLIKGSSTADFVNDEEGEVYLFNNDERPFKLPYEMAADLVRTYVKGGGNFTAEQTAQSLRRKHRSSFTTAQVQQVLSAFNVKKDSLPLAPHQLTTQADAEAHLNEALVVGLKDTLEADKSARYQKFMEKSLKDRLIVEDFVTQALGTLPPLDIIEVPAPQNNEHNTLEAHTAVLVLSDWHVGKVVNVDGNSFNKDIFKARVERLKEEIYEYFNFDNTRPLERLVILCAGDMLDGVRGDMHDLQSNGQDIHGAEQVGVAAKALAEVVIYAGEVADCDVNVHFISGNHDRVAKSRDEDQSRIAGEMLFMLAKAYSAPASWIEWNYRSSITACIDVHDTRILLTHGDRNPRNTRDLVFSNLSKSAEHYVIVSGHLHSFQTEDFGVLTIRCGSLCGVDEYAKERLGKGAPPSQAIFTVRKSGPRAAVNIPLR